MLQQFLNYIKKVINYGNSPIHYYDNREYKIKDTIYKNGCVQVSSVDRI